ncbi:MAG: hypothetical protein A2X22_09640 [Bacteroidetes bacterium GWF2_49_14]|nr:MAG: hypothetical protein A2X22_09640 [Bacteroidetes bacterium GWF2_49_14]
MYLAILLVLVIVLIVMKVVPGKQDKGLQDQNLVSGTSGDPVFRKEGELSFLRPDSSLIVKIDIEIADDDPQRELGLMYRKTMEMHTGMLFIFEDTDLRSFWMKNTYIPLDIIYLDAQKKIIRIHENAPTLNEQPIPSDYPAKYVVEVIAGFTALYNIRTGDLFTFRR